MSTPSKKELEQQAIINHLLGLIQSLDEIIASLHEDRKVASKPQQRKIDYHLRGYKSNLMQAHHELDDALDIMLGMQPVGRGES